MEQAPLSSRPRGRSGVKRCTLGGRPGFEQLFLAVDKRINVVCGKLKPMSMSDGVSGTGLNTIAAEDAPGIIDIIDFRVALAGGNAFGIGILGGLDVDAVGRTGGGAEEASHTLLKTLLIAVQDVNAAIARMKVDRLVGIVFGGGLAQPVEEGEGKPLRRGDERLTDLLPYAF